MSYIGNPIVSTDFPVDYASGNGATVAFTLSVAPASVNSIAVQISGVSQSPQTYSVSGTTLTFSAAPPSGTNNIVVRHLGVAGIPNTPSAGSVVTTSIANNAVTPAKMANGGAEFGMRNRIINGAMVISQYNSTTQVTPTAGAYVIDRFLYSSSQASKFTAQQLSASPPVGYTNYLGLVSTAATSLGAGDFFGISQRIEGYNIADLGFGSANAKTVTLSFWVQSSLTGTFSGSIGNGAFDVAYGFTYSIPVANTWTQISVTIPGSTTGTWLTTNGNGMRVYFSLGVGSTYGTTANTWVASGSYGVTAGTNVAGTNGATFYITGVQLEVGSSATGYEYRQYGQELTLCQRYFYKVAKETYATALASCTAYSTTIVYDTTTFPFPVTMRAEPTMTSSGGINLHDGLGNTPAATLAYESARWGTTFSGTTSTGLTVGRIYYVKLNNTGVINASAEL